jgi:hypothetical protein
MEPVAIDRIFSQILPKELRDLLIQFFECGETILHRANILDEGSCLNRSDPFLPGSYGELHQLLLTIFKEFLVGASCEKREKRNKLSKCQLGSLILLCPSQEKCTPKDKLL